MATPNNSLANRQTNSLRMSDEFDSDFKFIIEDIKEILETQLKGFPAGAQHTVPWVCKVLNYNVPGGKQIRGRMVELCYKHLMPDANPDQLKQARVLGLCIEILQASFLVADDIMDAGKTRRGKPCWCLVDNMGNIALNDAFLLEHVVFQLLQKHFRNHACYMELVTLFLNVTWRTILGQSLDTRLGHSKSFEHFTPPVYNFIAAFKTGYYTVYLPVQLAMALANKKERFPDSFHEQEKLLLLIGTIFQIMDDYIDCFASDSVTGKQGTDIQEGKCSWLSVSALEICNSEQRELFEEQYGKAEKVNVESIRKLYHELGLPSHFDMRKEKLYCKIAQRIKVLGDGTVSNILYAFLDKVCKQGNLP